MALFIVINVDIYHFFRALRACPGTHSERYIIRALTSAHPNPDQGQLVLQAWKVGTGHFARNPTHLTLVFSSSKIAPLFRVSSSFGFCP